MSAIPEIVGIGAVNLDHAVDVGPLDPAATAEAPLVAWLRERLTARGLPFAWDAEIEVDADTNRVALADIGAELVETVPGGSALNTLTALARTGLGIKSGFVGVAGSFPEARFTARDVFTELNIDDRHVGYDEISPAGSCLAVVNGDRRALLTHAGANIGMAFHLRGRRDELVDYLADARIIHVTSLLDPDSPRVLLELLRAVRQRNPEVIVTVDPGHVWATRPTPATSALIGLSTIVLLNDQEFAGVGQRAAADTDGDVAGRILTSLHDRRGHVLLKRAEGITVFGRQDGAVRHYTLAQDPLPPDKIVDSLGAGDVFTAGVLAALAGGKPLDVGLPVGVILGMNLARHALARPRTREHPGFPLIARTVLDLVAAKGIW